MKQPFHPEDYTREYRLEIISMTPDCQLSEIIRHSLAVSEIQAYALTDVFDILKSDGLKDGDTAKVGNVNMWVTCHLKFIGPPNRNPELKYKTPPNEDQIIGTL